MSDDRNCFAAAPLFLLYSLEHMERGDLLKQKCKVQHENVIFRRTI